MKNVTGYWSRTLIATAIAAAVSVPASAAILNGVFDVHVYQGLGSGNIADPNNQAVIGNPLIVPGAEIAHITYTGDLNFNATTNTVLAFFQSGGGGISTITGGLAYPISTGNFGTTTVMTFSGSTFGQSWGGTITHDDGVTLYNTFGNAGSALASSAGPTSSISTSFANLNSSNWGLVYVAANDLPEVLAMDVSSRVPEPATLGIIGLGLGLIGTASQRRKKV